MRNLFDPAVDKYRVRTPGIVATLGIGDETCGAFIIPVRNGRHLLRVIAASAEGWDHVSVSMAHRPPRWNEMARVVHLFFEPTETVMQLHVPIADHVNCHPNCLHLWRPHDDSIPRPPQWMVGPDKDGNLNLPQHLKDAP